MCLSKTVAKNCPVPSYDFDLLLPGPRYSKPSCGSPTIFGVSRRSTPLQLKPFTVFDSSFFRGGPVRRLGKVDIDVALKRVYRVRSHQGGGLYGGEGACLILIFAYLIMINNADNAQCVSTAQTLVHFSLPRNCVSMICDEWSTDIDIFTCQGSKDERLKPRTGRCDVKEMKRTTAAAYNIDMALYDSYLTVGLRWSSRRSSCQAPLISVVAIDEYLSQHNGSCSSI